MISGKKRRLLYAAFPGMKSLTVKVSFTSIVPLTSAIHTKVKSSPIMRLSCGNTLKSPWEPAPLGAGHSKRFRKVSRSAQSRS